MIKIEITVSDETVLAGKAAEYMHAATMAFINSLNLPDAFKAKLGKAPKADLMPEPPADVRDDFAQIDTAEKAADEAGEPVKKTRKPRATKAAEPTVPAPTAEPLPPAEPDGQDDLDETVVAALTDMPIEEPTRAEQAKAVKEWIAKNGAGAMDRLYQLLAPHPIKGDDDIPAIRAQIEIIYRELGKRPVYTGVPKVDPVVTRDDVKNAMVKVLGALGEEAGVAKISEALRGLFGEEVDRFSRIPDRPDALAAAAQAFTALAVPPAPPPSGSAALFN